MMKKNLLIFFSFLFNFLFAQQYEDFGFERNTSIVVKDNLNNIISNPWGGGLNSCQFSEIDLNFDGKNDLFIYDRSSAKIVTFINNGNANSIDYTYAPEYRERFPEIHYWAKLMDYNNDGKEDIFTYAYGGGIAVYKNTGNATTGLKFTKVVEPILSLQDSQYSNILVTNVDFPAISDIDSDGDLDILNFWGLGEYVQFHKNLSMELYGNADSLKFERQEFCWGDFKEGVSDNKISLNIICPNKSGKENEENDFKHTGSTMLALDLNGDNLKDLLLGDVDFPGLIALNNGGTINDALMTSTDTLYPSNTNKINLFSFPVPSFLDVNNDNKKDLLVSPFDVSMTIAENQKSCWLYNNSGTSSSPVFNYSKNNFLQGDMIDLGSGAYPVFYDYDGDGLKDLFISNFGTRDSSYYSNGFLYSIYISGISLYKNTGTSVSPQFTLITDDFANIRSRKLIAVYPAFGDIDNDGAAEMIIGKSNGKIDLYENTAAAGQPMNMVLSQTDYFGIYVGNTPTQTYPSATPQLFDLDKDLLLDLIIGEKAGTLNFYKNTGSATNPQFTLITDSLGKVDVTKHTVSNYGYSIPCLFTDSAGNTKLFVGSESGNIYYYKNIDNNINGKFTLVDSNYLYINEGMHSAVAVAELDGNNFPEMVVGNFSGGVTYYSGTHPNPVGFAEYYKNENNLEIFPNPAASNVNITIPNELKNKKILVEIFNINGKVIFNKEIISPASSATLDISQAPSGLYFIRLQNYSAKLMIQR